MKLKKCLQNIKPDPLHNKLRLMLNRKDLSKYELDAIMNDDGSKPSYEEDE